MCSFLYFILLSVFFVWDASNYSEEYGFSSEIISFIKIKEEHEKEFLVTPLGANSAIIVDAGSGSNDNAVLTVFGDAFSTQFDEIGLSDEEKNEMSRIFSNDCNADVMSYLISVLSTLFVSLKQYECELKLLEKSYRACRGYGGLMRRIKRCNEVEEKYRQNRRGGRETLSQIKKFGEKTIQCATAISRGLWLAGKHTNVENVDSTVECTEQQLLNEQCSLTTYKVFYSVLLSALISVSVSSSKCKEKRKCRKVSRKCKCIFSTADQIEELINELEKKITDKNAFIRSCTKHLINTSGSVNTNQVRAPSEEIDGGLKEITQVSQLLTGTF
ncbi:hypothetical protein [Cryptosporidium parvum Iowa II]|uniref:Uncharacterized protein n=2 Tax=Cryptosporidium parvum TaxID=5807 RepID=Q5CUS3_CRYPI|nr:hypothetical protein [Cryptosporidium parvum Iowa II]EAK89126.1 conserved hypothetical protein [Cryptosporidium parvum Iowa II]QOY42518.1 Uncharacterized protein CPATCC_0032650 [Cryptosporidium parvum]WKS76911.1 hypothetical protein CPCDC_3g1690 [Cryptosporidium sp. 43IA8]WRK31403.1 Uncharacterized protein cpbgf_3001690 [Cryptosporidium parvum]|eukprot:QOY42518.1 hypothetical protein CPATCC_001164 [Cryptosporidium parvum]